MLTLTVLGVRISICKKYPQIWMSACKFSPWTSIELMLQKCRQVFTHLNKCPCTSFRQKKRIIWKLDNEDLHFLTDLLHGNTAHSGEFWLSVWLQYFVWCGAFCVAVFFCFVCFLGFFFPSQNRLQCLFCDLHPLPLMKQYNDALQNEAWRVS